MTRLQAPGLRPQSVSPHSVESKGATGPGLRIVAILLLLSVPGSASAQELFDFHSAFWMNLHHYLHALGRASEPLIEELPAGATDVDRGQWTAAVDFYRSRFGKRRLVFDEMLVGIKQQLIVAESRDSIADLTLTPEHRQVLERVAPIYRTYRWAEHDATNKRFIAALQSLVSKHGKSIADRLSRSYDATWPAEGLRVDVVRDAGPPGNAYTTTVPRPTHVTIGADDQGLTSLELLFHESSHNWDQRLMKGVQDAAQALGIKPPPDLWHALLFFNAGRITTETLAAAGILNYEQMMVRGKIFARPGWHEAIARHWPAVLAGNATREDAITRILADLK